MGRQAGRIWEFGERKKYDQIYEKILSKKIDWHGETGITKKSYSK